MACTKKPTKHVPATRGSRRTKERKEVTNGPSSSQKNGTASIPASTDKKRFGDELSGPSKRPRAKKGKTAANADTTLSDGGDETDTDNDEKGDENGSEDVEETDNGEIEPIEDDDIPHAHDQEVTLPKPPPIGTPEVWAAKRQGLCSTLPYYQGYQSGGYSHGGILLGNLLDGHPGERDLIDHDGVVIMIIGGGRNATTEDGKGRKRSAHQQKKGPYKPIVGAMKVNQFIGLIAGDSCEAMPSTVPHAYNVMGWYFITDFWCEKDEDGYKFFKIRLQAIDITNQPWWAPQGSQDIPMTAPGEYVAVSQECSQCHQSSKKTFTQGWACLNYDCDSCFDFGFKVKVNELTYDTAFLKERTVYTGKPPATAGGARIMPPSLIPDHPTQGPRHYGTEKHLRKGIVCPQCHGCNSRAHWSGWVYETPNCGYRVDCNMLQWPLAKVQMASSKLEKRRRFKKINRIRELQVSTNICGYKVTVYPLPDIRPGLDGQTIVGTLVHFRPTEAVKAAPNGPNDLFNQLHIHAKTDDWQRLPVVRPGKKSQILTSHFVQNYGAPYEYVVTVGSKPFSQAPDTVLRALMRMRWAGSAAIATSQEVIEDMTEECKGRPSNTLAYNFVDFNELLALGYFEEDKINWHDDGEKTLGPTVATLSLGAPAVMGFRPKVSGLGGGAPSSFDVPLLHGDMVVMHGTEIHSSWLHRVVPHGDRRFALTSRHIDLNKLSPADHIQGLQLGQIPAHANAFQYNGF